MLGRISKMMRGETRTVATLTSFPEENLLKSAKEGGGYAEFSLRDSLKDGRYKVIRKLGVGQYSTTWLVLDSENSKSAEPRRTDFCAAKVLTSYATRLHDDGVLNELPLWKSLSGRRAVARLFDDFYHETPGGRHLCFITQAFSINISQFRRSLPNKVIPPYVLKPLLSSVLDGLKSIHDANIAHGDVKPTNVLINCPDDNVTMARILTEEPLQLYGEFELQDQRYPAFASQSLPHIIAPDISPSDAEKIGACLVDYGHSQRLDQAATAPAFGAFALRPPEVILGGGLSKEFDVWGIGCMVYELLTGNWLFDPKANETLKLEDNHLAQMLEISRENFDKTVLGSFPKWNEYLNDNGELLREDKDRTKRDLEEELSKSPVIEATKVAQVASFIRACVHLDPSKRPPVSKLSIHIWMMDAFMPGHEWPGPVDKDGFILTVGDDDEGPPPPFIVQ